MWREPSTEWHLRQPWSAATRSPSRMRLEPAGTCSAAMGLESCATVMPRRWAAIQASNSAAGITTSSASMAEWPSPQYSAQKIWYVPWLVGLEPGVGVAARERVLLEPQRRHEEGVDHVPRGDEQAHRPAGRHPQHVQRAGPARIGELPHPLLALHVDVHRVLGGRVQVDEERKADGEPEQEEEERRPDEEHLVDGPGRDVRGGIGVGAAPVAEEEEEGGPEHPRRRDHGGDDHEVVEVIHLAGVVARLLGEEQHPAQELVHACAPCRARARSRQKSRPIRAARAASVRSPPMRRKPKAKGWYFREAGSYR